MMKIFSCVIFYSIILAIVSPQPITISIGALLDNTTRDGKEAKVAIEMAIDDFKTNQNLVLHIRNSDTTPAQTAIAARDLINSLQIKALFGPHAWEESSIVAELGSESNIPTLSLADSTPSWAIERWPFLLQASPSQYTQMKVVAAIVDSWGWRCLSIVYEDIDSTSSEVIPHLSHALQGLHAKISNILALPPFSSSSSLSSSLKRLKSDQCRVFVVHTSFPMAIRLFQTANKMGMMEKDYVWITTNTFTDFVHSINDSIISSMQGVVGVRSYFPKNGQQVQDFKNRFCTKFHADHPEEYHPEPGIFAVQAYDAARVVVEALNQSNSLDGQELLQKISMVNLTGLIGEVQFKKRKLAPSHIFQIVNVAGRSYRELGYWSKGLGFSENIDDKASCRPSMEILGQVIWPGGPLYTPRGWNLPTSINPIKVGVPSESAFRQYVTVTYNHWNNSYSYSGFSIDVFIETMNRLPYNLTYKFEPFNGTYDALVEQIYLKKYDAVAGDVSIVAKRYKHAEFTHRYTDIGVVMVVAVQSQLLDETWFFLKPFTKGMWAVTLAIAFYNGFVVWVIEPDLVVGDSVLDIIGTPIWLGFSTLFAGHGGRLRGNMSRIASVVWLFVALIIIQSYAASLSSILTVQRLQPRVTSIEQLKKSNAMIGYDKGSFVASYLMDVLDFKPNSLKEMASPEEYAVALKSGDIGAAFLETAPSKLFLANYGKMFTIVGRTYKVGGYAFAFPIGSPLLYDVTEALLNVSESGELQRLENKMTGPHDQKQMEMQMESASGSSENGSLSLHSFWVLFLLTGGTSTVFLAISMISKFFKSCTDRARIC